MQEHGTFQQVRFVCELVVNVACSASVSVANKILFREGMHPVLLLTLHYAGGYACSSIYKTVRDEEQDGQQLPRGLLFLVSATTILNLVTAQWNLKSNSIFVFQAGRYLAIFLTALGDKIVNSLKVGPQKQIGLLFILLAVCCIIVPLATLSCDHHGVHLAICMFAAVFQAVNGVSTNFVLKHFTISSRSLLNRLSLSISISLFGASSFVCFEGNCVVRSLTPMLVPLFVSMGSAIIIQYTSLVLTRGSSATFYSSVNVLKAALLSVGGSIALHENVSKLQLLAFCLSSLGLLLFSEELLNNRYKKGAFISVSIVCLVKTFLELLNFHYKSKVCDG